MSWGAEGTDDIVLRGFVDRDGLELTERNARLAPGPGTKACAVIRQMSWLVLIVNLTLS